MSTPAQGGIPNGQIGALVGLKVVEEDMPIVYQDLSGNPPTVIPTPAPCLEYKLGDDHATIHHKIDTEKGEIRKSKITVTALSGLVRVMQRESRKKDFADVEEIDHKVMLEDLLKHHDDPLSADVQVFDGDEDKVKVDDFMGNNWKSIRELIHFIEVNNLQDKRPWCTVWNLYQCMLVASGR